MRAQNLIAGEWIDAAETFPVRDPATDEVLAHVPNAGPAETSQAIDAAHHALPAWKTTPAIERASTLRRLAAIIRRDEAPLTELLCREQGKPRAEGLGEIRYAAGFIDSAADEAAGLRGEILAGPWPHKRALVLREAVGVVAAITPWNFPSAMVTRKLAPALAAGCTVVLKPAEQTPLSAIAIAERCLEAGLPPGTVNLITGEPAPIGRAIFADPRVRRVSFTGSTEVGCSLMALASTNITRLSLELGGHAPCIIFDDADLTRALDGLIAAKFRNAGQTCICPNRVYVQEGVAPEFLARLRERVAALRLGAWNDPDAQIGPLIDDAGVEKVLTHVDDARRRGARVSGGERAAPPRPGLAPRFVNPGVIEGLTPDMLCAREETFGPVVACAAFRDEREAIRLANDTPYGLAAYAFTRDLVRIIRLAETLEYGIVAVNDGSPSTPYAPFGGVKASGFGREGGRHGVEEFTELKYVSLGL